MSPKAKETRKGQAREVGGKLGNRLLETTKENHLQMASRVRCC